MYPSHCITCGTELTSEEFGGVQCFVCEYEAEFDETDAEEEEQS